MLVIRLPIPPSVNALYYNRKRPAKGQRGRGKTAKYRHWIAEADKWYLMQKASIKPMRGKLEIQIRVPKTRADISGLIKSAEDFLVSREITGDDKHNHRISIQVDETVDCCVVTILPME